MHSLREFKKQKRVHSNSIALDSSSALKIPDFQRLAEKYPSFKQYIFTNRFGGVSIDWKNAHAVRELTTILLLDEYEIKIELPIDQLCPMVTNRVNYIHWLKELLCVSTKQKKTNEQPLIRDGEGSALISPSTISGIDIGTGASCIYPLLGRRLYGWRFIATDIEAVSIEIAKRNVELNGWQNDIDVRLVASNGAILTNLVEGTERIDFCMCNPPFFEEISQTGLNRKVVCTGTIQEMVVEGGEKQFVSRMIEESILLQDRIRWYTAMIGRKEDLKSLLKRLRTKGIVNVRTTEFHQGRTTRWGLGWSHSSEGLKELVETKIFPKTQQLNRCSSFPVSGSRHPSEILRILEEDFKQHQEIHYRTDPIVYSIKGDVRRPGSQQKDFPRDLLQMKPLSYVVDCKFKGGSSKEDFYLFLERIQSVLS